MTAGFLVAGPVSGYLSDRFGAARLRHRRHAAIFGGSFIGLLLLPVDFPYWAFALLIALNGIGGGMFAAPNTSSIMGSVPARQRGVASGHAGHLPELRHGAVDRRLLLADDRRPGQHAAARAHRRPAAQGVPAGVAHAGRQPAAGVVAVRRGPRRQPDPAPARAQRRAGAAAAGQASTS